MTVHDWLAFAVDHLTVYNWFVFTAGLLYAAATVQALHQQNWKVAVISIAYSIANFVISMIKG